MSAAPSDAQSPAGQPTAWRSGVRGMRLIARPAVSPLGETTRTRSRGSPQDAGKLPRGRGGASAYHTERASHRTRITPSARQQSAAGASSAVRGVVPTGRKSLGSGRCAGGRQGRWGGQRWIDNWSANGLRAGGSGSGADDDVVAVRQRLTLDGGQPVAATQRHHLILSGGSRLGCSWGSLGRNAVTGTGLQEEIGWALVALVPLIGGMAEGMAEWVTGGGCSGHRVLLIAYWLRAARGAHLPWSHAQTRRATRAAHLR